MTSVVAWKAAESYFDFKGHQIFFRDDGRNDAPAVLLVHGLPSASWDFDLIWPELVKKYRVLDSRHAGLWPNFRSLTGKA